MAGRLRMALIRQAELAAAAGSYGAAGSLAERALHTAGAAAPGAEELQRLHRLMLAAGTGEESTLQLEIRELGVPLARSTEEARGQLARVPVPVPAQAGRLYGRDRELARVRAALGAGNRRLV